MYGTPVYGWKRQPRLQDDSLTPRQHEITPLDTGFSNNDQKRPRELPPFGRQGIPPRFPSRESARNPNREYPPVQPAAASRKGYGDRPVNRRIVVTVTSKGGTGKSFFLINLADWLAEKQARFTCFDTDWSSGTLTRFLPDSRFLPTGEEGGLEEVFNALEDSDIALLDGSPAAIPEIVEWVENLNTTGDRAIADVAVTFVCMVEEDKDTVFQAGELFRRLGNTVDWLVVRSLKTGQATEIYDGSKARQELLRLGGGEMTVARLPWNLLSVMQRTSLSLAGMAQNKSLSLLERHRLKSYQERLSEQFLAVESVLLTRPGARAGSGARRDQTKGTSGPRIAPEDV